LKERYDDPSVFAAKASQNLREMARMAHAITGNREIAVYITQIALREAYFRRAEWASKMPVREGLERTLVAVACQELARMRKAGEFEADWTPEFQGESKVIQRLSREDNTSLRAMVMEYGCGMSRGQIARALGIPLRTVQKIQRRRRKRLSILQGSAASAEDMLEQIAAAMLTGEHGAEFDVGMLLRAFERDIYARPTERRLPIRQILIAISKVAGVLILAALVWLACILTAPETLP
jgi:DNA-directed RNA polymerase specialized sigma24 family protein